MLKIRSGRILTSKIINMAEIIKDAEDRFLESVFRTDSVADNGFSRMVMRRIRRRLWIKRLAMPIAVVVGAAVAFKPLVGLAAMLAGILQLVPDDMLASASQALPHLSTYILGAMLLAACMLGLRTIEE